MSFFNAELNGTFRILSFRCAIIDLLWPSWVLLGHSRSIMAQRKHKNSEGAIQFSIKKLHSKIRFLNMGDKNIELLSLIPQCVSIIDIGGPHRNSISWPEKVLLWKTRLVQIKECGFFGNLKRKQFLFLIIFFKLL